MPGKAARILSWLCFVIHCLVTKRHMKGEHNLHRGDKYFWLDVVPLCAPLSIYILNDLNDPSLIVWDVRVLKLEPMPSCWSNLLSLFVFHYFHFIFLSWVGCVGLGSSDWCSVWILFRLIFDDEADNKEVKTFDNWKISIRNPDKFQYCIQKSILQVLFSP